MIILPPTSTQKNRGSPKYKLDPRVSEGLAGKVEKNETYLPHGPLISPLETGNLPDLDEDRSITLVNALSQIPFLAELICV